MFIKNPGGQLFLRLPVCLQPDVSQYSKSLESSRAEFDVLVILMKEYLKVTNKEVSVCKLVAKACAPSTRGCV